jgi:IS30 family transposase
VGRCGSSTLGVIINEPRPISARFLTQDDRIVIADGLRAGLSVKQIGGQIGKSFQTVYREVRGNSKPDGSYQPWWAHNQAVLRRRRPKPVKLAVDTRLRQLVLAQLKLRWSPQQIARFLTRTSAHDARQRVCAETIYRALFGGLLGKKEGMLRTGRRCRKPQRRGAMRRNDIPNIRPLSQRPATAEDRVEPGHWERDLIIGRAQRSAIATLVERTSCPAGSRQGLTGGRATSQTGRDGPQPAIALTEILRQVREKIGDIA